MARWKVVHNDVTLDVEAAPGSGEIRIGTFVADIPTIEQLRLQLAMAISIARPAPESHDTP